MRRRILLTVMLAVMLTAPELPVLADPGPVVHTVQPGDTLSNIARRYCTTWQELVANAGARWRTPTNCTPARPCGVIDRCGGGWPGGGRGREVACRASWTGLVDHGARGPDAQGSCRAARTWWCARRHGLLDRPTLRSHGCRAGSGERHQPLASLSRPTACPPHVGRLSRHARVLAAAPRWRRLPAVERCTSGRDGHPDHAGAREDRSRAHFIRR